MTVDGSKPVSKSPELKNQDGKEISGKDEVPTKSVAPKATFDVKTVAFKKKAEPKFDEAAAIIDECVGIVKEVVGGVGSNTRMNYLKSKIATKFPDRASDLQKAISDVFKTNVTDK